jgi:hypothetical protein
MRKHMAGHTDTWLRRGVSGAGNGDKGADSLYARERIPEEGNEGYGLAMLVVLKMDGTLGEESGLVRRDLVEDEFTAILWDHARDERAVGDIVELWGPGMGVRRVQAAWSKETGSCKIVEASVGQGWGADISRTD